VTVAPQPAAGARSLPRPLLAAGFAGSLLVGVGALGAGARPEIGFWPELPPVVGTVLVAVGVLLLVGAWWRARRTLDDVAPGALVRATALWSLPLLVAPPVFSRDVYSYAGQALLAARGISPYEQGPSAVPGEVAAEVDDVWLDTPAPYGPAFLGPAALLLRLTGDDVVPAVLLLRLLAVLGLVLTALALPHLARACGVPAQRALWLGLTNPLGLLHGVGGAHNDALMVGLLVAGAAVALAPPIATRAGVVRSRLPGVQQGAARPAPDLWRWIAAGALVALAGLVKAPALGALPFLALAAPGGRQRLRAAAALAAGAVAAAVLTTLLSGLGFGWLGTLGAGRARLSLFSPTTGLGTALGTLAEAVGLTDDGDAVREVVLTGGVVAALLLAAALLWRTVRGPASPRACVQGFGLALLAVVVLSPTVLPWYLLWAVVPLAAAVGQRAAAALASASAVLCLTVWPSGRVVLRPPLYGIPTLLAAAVAARTSHSYRGGGPTRAEPYPARDDADRSPSAGRS